MSTLFPEIVVNGTILSAADIAAEAQNQAAPKGKPGLAWRRAARALTIRHLLLQEAGHLGLTPTPREVAPGQFETDQEALIRDVMEQSVDPDPVQDSDLTQVYDRHPDGFRAPSLYQPAHILVSVPSDELRPTAREHAEALLARVLKNPREFGKIARSDSECGSASADGQLGQLSSGDTVPEFEAAMKIAEIDQIHPELVETRYGYHILRMDARAQGDVLPFSAVRDRLKQAQEKANWTRAAREYADALVAKAQITGIDLEAVA